jgi:hypothetical protein
MEGGSVSPADDRSSQRRRLITITVLVVAAALGTAVGVFWLNSVPPTGFRDGHTPMISDSRGTTTLTQPSQSPELATSAARIAYQSNDVVYMQQLGKPAAKLATLVDLDWKHPQVDYLTGLAWSGDGRYLAWSQQLADDIAHPDEQRPTRTTTLTILDTTTGQRQSWYDDDAPYVGVDLRFVSQTLATIGSNTRDNTIGLYRVGQAKPQYLALPAHLSTAHLIGMLNDRSLGDTTNDGILLSTEDSATKTTTHWLVKLNGDIDALGAKPIGGPTNSVPLKTGWGRDGNAVLEGQGWQCKNELTMPKPPYKITLSPPGSTRAQHIDLPARNGIWEVHSWANQTGAPSIALQLYEVCSLPEPESCTNSFTSETCPEGPPPTETQIADVRDGKLTMRLANLRFNIADAATCGTGGPVVFQAQGPKTALPAGYRADRPFLAVLAENGEYTTMPIDNEHWACAPMAK